MCNIPCDCCIYEMASCCDSMLATIKEEIMLMLIEFRNKHDNLDLTYITDAELVKVMYNRECPISRLHLKCSMFKATSMNTEKKCYCIGCKIYQKEINAPPDEVIDSPCRALRKDYENCCEGLK